MTISIEFDRLLKLRLVVARYGEMDGARWWNTNGVLGRKGGLLMSRGFPKTHRFAQARLVFEVAKARSAERFPVVPGCITLWDLPADVEEAFDARWATWIDNSEAWDGFFDGLESLESDLLSMLRERSLLDSQQEQEVSRMRRSAEGRSVPLPGARHSQVLGGLTTSQRSDDETVTLLAAGFARGEQGKLAIPYARLEG
jgi:hypothetical protein